MIEINDIKRYFDHIKQIKKSHKFYDCHVHPFDVILNRSDYSPLTKDNAIYSENGSDFVPPELEPILLKRSVLESEDTNPDLLKKLILMQIKKQYKCIGPGVMKAHSDLSGIDESLLLQVSKKEGDIDEEMQLVTQLYSQKEGFMISGSLPNYVKNPEISVYIKKMVDQYKIKAFKLHPIITGIDISKYYGKERVESILLACSENKLPLVIHGGTSYLFKGQPEETYTDIENLEKINWSLSNSFVVIAHAASYDCELTRVKDTILPLLKKMLDMHSNLLIDIAAIEFEPLVAVLTYVDIDRIIFGSDALYYDQWSTMIKLFHALKKFPKSDENFLKIMSFNPEKTLFNNA